MGGREGERTEGRGNGGAGRKGERRERDNWEGGERSGSFSLTTRTLRVAKRFERCGSIVIYTHGYYLTMLSNLRETTIL